MKILQLNPVQHVYDLETCMGCEEELTETYTEIGLPNGDGTEVTHRGLCSSCSSLARSEGAF